VAAVAQVSERTRSYPRATDAGSNRPQGSHHQVKFACREKRFTMHPRVSVWDEVLLATCWAKTPAATAHRKQHDVLNIPGALVRF
jgi:hypothetical protein